MVKHIKWGICLTAFWLWAQEGILAQDRTGFRQGARFGMGEASLDPYPESGATETGKLALLGGVAVSNYFNENVGIGADLLISSKGGKARGVVSGGFGVGNQPYTDIYQMFSAEMPINFRAGFALGNIFLNGFAGPSVQFSLLQSHSRIYDDASYDRNYGYRDRAVNGVELLEFAFVYGLSFEVANTSDEVFFLDFRINNGISDLFVQNNQAIRSGYFAITAGYAFK